MSQQYYGFRCYSPDDQKLGWLERIDRNGIVQTTLDRERLRLCKRWKTERGAKRNFAFYNRQWRDQRGGYLKIETLPDFPESKNRKYWDEANPDAIAVSKNKYDRKNPVWSFRPNSILQEWLNQERFENENNAQLIARKLEKLRKLENQGL